MLVLVPVMPLVFSAFFVLLTPLMATRRFRLVDTCLVISCVMALAGLFVENGMITATVCLGQLRVKVGVASTDVVYRVLSSWETGTLFLNSVSMVVCA